MGKIRSTNELILSALDFYRNAQSNLDTKPGTVARDLLIDGPSTQLSRLYEELARIKSSQSLALSLGVDLDRLAQNFGEARKRGSIASGTAVYTMSEIEADIPINKGDIITANNGATFTVTTSMTVSAVFANTYRATASRLRADLDTVGISDEFAVEVPVQATAAGSIGNISKFSLISTSTPGISNITNVAAFGGGSQAENDASFKSRTLSVFSGANTGTALGYENAARGDNAVLDAIVIEPGDDLMTRDGTQVIVAENGARTIVSEGTGGKVDIYVFGTRLISTFDSFIYRDQSNKDDPTDPLNDFVIGQIEGDENKTVNRRRKENLENGSIPEQPVNDIIRVSGSSSGSNFVEKIVDSLGRISGNYELIRDNGAFGGSPWGKDRLRWISDRISGFEEDQSKGRFNGQDALTFSDVLKINTIQQNIQIINENSRINSANRASVQLAHYPISNVTRVFNLTTGERYVVADQNPDGDGSINETGRILIRGNTLPAVSDTLQVDYTWVFEYDPYFDFDNRDGSARNPRTVVDSVDWGYSNMVRREESTVTSSGTQKLVSVSHPISSVINVNSFSSGSATVQLISGRLAIVVSNTVENVISIIRSSDLAELYVTSKNDGSFSGLTIFLPTDTVAVVGNLVSVRYNANDVYNINGVNGSFDDETITLSTSTDISIGTVVECNYISDVRTLMPAILLPALPALREGNGFKTDDIELFGTQPTTHVYSSPGIADSNLRMAPSRLQLTIAGQISPGVITVSGTTFTAVFDKVFTVSSTNGLKHNLSSIIKADLDLKTSDSVPSNVAVVRVVRVEKVTANNSLDVLSIDHIYDIIGYKLKNNSFVMTESVQNTALTSTEFELPSTPDNVENQPGIGDRLRVRFYYSTTDDSENISFSKSGSLFTNKTFALIDTIAISSGFTSGSSQTATLTVLNQNQPATGSRYTANYDYLAPKTNERITVEYNHNRLITDVTLNIETVRPINADVLIKAGTPILIDVTFNIVVTEAFKNSVNTVKQNVQDAVTNALNATSMGTTIDESDLIAVAAAVAGVDRVRSLFFNKTGNIGRVLSITAAKNQYLQANAVIINNESR